jgi:3-isopropylmalate/(R)-2-methylmalate dehydratase small subunit
VQRGLRRVFLQRLTRCVRAANGEAFPFKIDEFRKHCLLNGLDDIGLTLAKGDLIDTFEKKHLSTQPWLVGIGLKATAAR